MLPYFDYNEYYKFEYKNTLRKDSNRIGVMLIILFAVMFVTSFITVLIPTIMLLFSDISSDLAFLEDTTFLMIISGFASLLSCFLVPFIYCIATKSSAKAMFPFEKVSVKLLYLLCALGLAASIASNYASNLVLTFFESFGIDANIDTNFQCDSTMDIVLLYITVAIVPALAEEFAFRGFVLNYLRKYSDSLAILVSAILFGLLHGNFTQIPFAILVGLVLGLIAVKTNSLLPGIIIHFLNNAISVTFTLLESNTNLPDTVINLLNIIIMFIIAILGIMSFVSLSKNYSGFFKLQNTDDVIPHKEKVKTFFSSPAVIVFMVITIVEAIAMLNMEV